MLSKLSSALSMAFVSLADASILDVGVLVVLGVQLGNLVKLLSRGS